MPDEHVPVEAQLAHHVEHIVCELTDPVGPGKIAGRANTSLVVDDDGASGGQAGDYRRECAP
jgi:hypothetical protein